MPACCKQQIRDGDTLKRTTKNQNCIADSARSSGFCLFIFYQQCLIRFQLHICQPDGSAFRGVILAAQTALDYAVKRDLLLHTAMAFLQGFPMLNCGDEIAQLNGWDYKNDPDRVEDSRNLHRSKFNWEDAKQRTQKGTLQNQLWQGMEQLRQMRADPCFAPDAWVTTWDSHNPGVLALVRKRGEETLVGLFNFTEYPAGASLDALGGEYHTPEGTSVWLADVELEPYQALLVKNK